MYGFSIVLSSETASFRDPGGQLYHATLPLPPVSTIIGIAGAALGEPFQNAWEIFRAQDISVGVKDISDNWRGVPAGRGLDLWKFRKIVSKQVRSDVLNREFLFRPVFCIYYGCEDWKALYKLQQAFLSPSWALTLGTSDDIARLEKVCQVEPIKEVLGGAVDLSHCLIPGDHADNFSFDWDFIRDAPIHITLELPIVKQLPVEFLFSQGGQRKGSKYQPFTFLSNIQRLKNPCPAYAFGQQVVPLISIA